MSAVLTPGAGVQNDLPLWKRLGFPVASPLDTERFVRLLGVLRDGRWHIARELKVHGFSDRELRELVENSDGQIFSLRCSWPPHRGSN